MATRTKTQSPKPKTQSPEPKTQSAKPVETSLVGRCFHVFGQDRKVQYQGIVRGMVNDTHALVQYFEWVMGEPNTMEIVPVERMSVSATASDRAPGSWQFYEDHEHMNYWYETHKPARRE